MSKVCAICGKGKTFEHNVSHSNRKTNRPVNANLQKVSMEVNGNTTSEYVCAKCIKTSKKNAK